MSLKIKAIHFKKETTILGFAESYQPRDANQVANETTPAREFDLPRHADFERAMDKMKPHLLIACEYQKPQDYNGNFLQKSHFDDYFADTDDEEDRFGGLDMTAVIILGKNASDGVILCGTKTTSYGEVVKIKTPSISLVKSPDGYNYPLLAILDAQLDTLLHEAEEYRSRKKHGAGVQTAMSLQAAEKLAQPPPGAATSPTDELDRVILEKQQSKGKEQLSLAGQQ